MESLDIGVYSGLGQFGEAYRVMLENDAHAPGSVDRALMERMVRLCAATASLLYGPGEVAETLYTPGARPGLERVVRSVTAGCASGEEDVAAIALYTAELARRAGGNGRAPADLVLGGREEEIILRGTDWCTDLARVACALCQVAGIPARIVYLADTSRAYSGHAIIEAHRQDVWGAVDPTGGVVYRWPEGRPATTWDLMSNPWLVARHADGSPYAREGQFRRAAIARYCVARADEYDYGTSTPNAYYRSVLEASAAGWPDGLRWLHGEEPCDETDAPEEAT